MSTLVSIVDLCAAESWIGNLARSSASNQSINWSISVH